MDRRDFTKSSILSAAGLLTIPHSVSALANSTKTRALKKGIMWGSIGVGKSIAEKFQAAKEAGFEGVEVMSHLDRNAVLKARDATGLAIPSVCGALHGTHPLSHPDAEERQKGLDALKVTLEDAAAYGASTILLVPGRVSHEVSYDDCWKRSVAEIRKVLPLAEKLNVDIAIENVWNNFLLSPMEAAGYVDQFDSPYVRFYFDCGNILFIGWPDQWIRILGKRISKVHMKEYSTKIADTQGKWAGFKVKLLEGDVNWNAVMTALDETGYSGWTTIEQPGGETPEGLKDLCIRLGKIQES